MNDMTVAKIFAAGYVGLVVLPTAIALGTKLIVQPVAKGIDYVVWKAKIAKGLKDGTIVEENGKYYEKFTVEDGPNYRKKKAETGKKHKVIIDI